MVVKFYREGRWSDAQILEEHAFALELAEQEIPVAAPLVLAGATLHGSTGFAWRVPVCAGAAPELDADGARELLGRPWRAFTRSVRAAASCTDCRWSADRGRAGARGTAAIRALPDHMRQRYER